MLIFVRPESQRSVIEAGIRREIAALDAGLVPAWGLDTHKTGECVTLVVSADDALPDVVRRVTAALRAAQATRARVETRGAA